MSQALIPTSNSAESIQLLLPFTNDEYDQNDCTLKVTTGSPDGSTGTDDRLKSLAATPSEVTGPRISVSPTHQLGNVVSLRVPATSKADQRPAEGLPFGNRANLSDEANDRSPIRRRPSIRLAKPTQIGDVMIRVLKRYGITDEEIADGIASYESKLEVGC